jgi:APA family basic amino acid/polyamine antiporter
LFFIIAAAALVLNTIVTQPARAGIGLGIVIIGIPAYLIWRYKSAHAEDTLLVEEPEE